MLSEIHINDFALIDKLHLTFSEGFSVLTGETGAGKSIIIDAISATLGERLSAEMVRSGAARAVVEAIFDLSDAPRVKERAADLDVEIEDDTMFITMELSRGGKSQRRVNGRICTLSTLRALTQGLLDLHGQHEHQSLLSAESHIDVLDNWLGAEAAELRQNMAEHYSTLRDTRRQLDDLRTNERERAQMLDLYKFQLSEIESAALTTGEEEQLEADRSRLANAEKLHILASAIYESLSGNSRESAGDIANIAQFARQAEQMAAMDPSVSQVAELLQNAIFAVEEAQVFMRAYRDDLEFNPQRLETIQERLDLIRSLKRKYGDTIESVLAYAENTAGKVRYMENSEEHGQELEVLLEKTLAQATKTAQELSDMRRSKAKDFETAVMKELAELAMERTEFQVSFEPGELSSKGSDAVEFLISPNPGEPLKPLSRIASGGEMSRIMLALKSVTAAADRIPTLIFDEIDTGIGGRTANVVGAKLAGVAAGCQVMCVTHLPQIACRAKSHLNVAKQIIDDRTVVRVTPLDLDERVHEIARMLGSAENTETALRHAKEMLRGAGSEKSCQLSADS
ncbi:MAG: DNA repair protein RecN [Armatimonadota bacterium]|nr:DNA repair protein RecN [Armatimonadota bacterium]